MPIVCPVCGVVYDPDRQPRPKRGGASAKEPAGNVQPAAAAGASTIKETKREAVVDNDADALVDSVDGDENPDADDMEEVASDENDLIEDTSDLGEDDDDLGEVMEHLDDDLEDKN